MPPSRSVTSIVALLLAFGATLAAGCNDSDDESDQGTGGPAAQGSTGGSGQNGKGKFQPGRGKAKGKQKPSGLSSDAPTYIGRFTRTVSTREAGQIGGRFGSAGRWSLFTGRGSYSVSNSRRGFGGTLRVSGRRITFGPPKIPKLPPVRVPQGGPGKNKVKQTRAQLIRQRELRQRALGAAREPCDSARGTYRWSLRGRTLTFRRIRDGCEARRVALSGPWSRRE